MMERKYLGMLFLFSHYEETVKELNLKHCQIFYQKNPKINHTKIIKTV